MGSWPLVVRAPAPQAEESAPLAVRLAAAAAHEAAVGGGGDEGGLLSQVGGAIARSDEAACAALEREVAAAVERLEGALTEHGLDDKVGAWAVGVPHVLHVLQLHERLWPPGARSEKQM